jgi:hypothetical protein
MLADRLPVTDQGIVIPKVWLGTATEVKLRHENGRLVIEPLPPKNGSGDESAIPADDPLWRLCDDPVDTGLTDASVNLDRYLYGSAELHGDKK